tara:strand:+ start:359 stop:622 length:264 start_codon:yes stop_codon:yes gene_type:complete
MIELTFEEFCELRFEYTLGMTFDNGAQRMYRNDEHSIQVEVYTDRNKRTGEWGEEKRYWFFDGDPRAFETIDQCYVAYMEKVCGVKS